MLWIGVLDKDSAWRFECQIDQRNEFITAPPRLNSIWLEQQSFQKLVGPFVWNYIVENELEGDKEDEDNDNDDDAATRTRGGELRSAIPLPTSNHLTPPPPVVAITLLPMGRKRQNLNDIDPSVTLTDDGNVEMLHPHLSGPLGGKKMSLILLTHLLVNLCKHCWQS